jgi:hypothetical protein
MTNGAVVAIHIAAAAEAAMRPVESVRALPGAGLAGDRYCGDQGSFFRGESPRADKEVTLIEQEALDALQREYGIELLPHESRRNLLTSGVALNHLVGREFSVGQARLKGIRLCEPCSHLERLTGRRLKGLVHRGGLRAQVLTGGEIRVGDSIIPAPPPEKRFSPEFLAFVKALGGSDCPGGPAH